MLRLILILLALAALGGWGVAFVWAMNQMTPPARGYPVLPMAVIAAPVVIFLVILWRNPDA